MNKKLNSLTYLTLILILLAGCTSDPDIRLARRFEKSLKHFAQTVLEHGRDHYGEKSTPLFVDGLHVSTLEPALWHYHDNQIWVTSNFASQQPLMRFLDGMTALTGKSEYREAAEQAAAYMLEHAVAPNGMLLWGGHTAMDLEKDRPVGNFRAKAEAELKNAVHEMKNQQPYYELMWRVNPEATRRMLMAILGGHIIDWELMDFNRHASLTRPAEPMWSAVFNESIEIPFPAIGNNLSFANASLSLIHAGSTLAALDKNEEALKWTERLVYRWQQGKHPETGLAGGQLSYLKDRDRGKIAFAHVHPQINEAIMITTYHRSSRYHNMPLMQMQNGIMLRERGGSFATAGQQYIDWALEDLKVYGERVYDPENKVFQSLLTDGTKLQWQEVKEGGNNYYFVNTGLGPAKPNGEIFWAYAMAYRLSKDPSHWKMAREMALALNLGDIGEQGGSRLSIGTDGLLEKTVKDRLDESDSWLMTVYSAYALLDLYEASGNKAFLNAASQIGMALLERQTENGLFPRTDRVYARTGDEVPLVLLHISAALSGKRDVLPKPMMDAHFFHMEYTGELEEKLQRVRPIGDLRTYDHVVYFGN